HALQPFFIVGAGIQRDLMGALHDLGHIDPERAIERKAIGGCRARQAGGIGACYQGLGRHAAGIDAGAPDMLALDDRDRHAGCREASGKRRPGLAGADDDGIEVPHDVPREMSAWMMSQAPRIATASSTNAAGMSRPKAFARAARAAVPP